MASTRVTKIFASEGVAALAKRLGGVDGLQTYSPQ
jgi:hypothetical protein